MTSAVQPGATSVAAGPRDVVDVVDRVGRLPLAVRDDLATVGERVAWLMRFGRKVRIVPMLFVLVWPFVVPGLLRDLLTARRLLAREDVQAALVGVAGVDFELAWNDEHERSMSMSTVRDLVLARESLAVLGVGIGGPPVIIVGFVIALIMAGR